jgi:hypothetical protein
MSRFEFFTATGIKLIATKSFSIESAINWFRITYPFWSFGYVIKA